MPSLLSRYYVYIIEQPLEVSSGSSISVSDFVSLLINGLIELVFVSLRIFVSDRDFINLLPVASLILLLSVLCGSLIADVEFCT